VLSLGAVRRLVDNYVVAIITAQGESRESSLIDYNSEVRRLRRDDVMSTDTERCLFAVRRKPAHLTCRSHNPAAVVAVLVAALQPRLGVVPFQVCELLSVDCAAAFPTTHIPTTSPQWNFYSTSAINGDNSWKNGPV